MSESLPEIEHIRRLLGTATEVTAQQMKRAAVRTLSESYAAIVGSATTFEALALLLKNVADLESVVDEQFKEPGRRAAAMASVERIEKILSPESIAIPYEEWLGNTQSERVFIESTIILLTDITFDSNELLIATPNIMSEIDALKSKFATYEGLSDASRLVVNAQLSLIERSIIRMETNGVGYFRDSIFTSIGRIYIELNTNPNNDKKAVRDVADDVLRIYGMLEVGGTLLKLGAPVAMKLLTAG